MGVFQSTRPARGATALLYLLWKENLPYFNPRAPRGARRKVTVHFTVLSKISIHAPREGRDLVDLSVVLKDSISIHAPREGRDSQAQLNQLQQMAFQSTRPARGATGRCRSSCMRSRAFQSTRPARGATAYLLPRPPLPQNFNPRAPRGARRKRISKIYAHLKFQSTRPARGATAKVNKFLCTFLQKRHRFQIFLRKTLPFKAFCRLQIGKNFSICGANRCGNFCELLLRTIRSSVLPEGRSACSQNAQFYSHTFSRDNRNADCLFPDP